MSKLRLKIRRKKQVSEEMVSSSIPQYEGPKVYRDKTKKDSKLQSTLPDILLNPFPKK